jgi:hypothetical protein
VNLLLIRFTGALRLTEIKIEKIGEIEKMDKDSKNIIVFDLVVALLILGSVYALFISFAAANSSTPLQTNEPTIIVEDVSGNDDVITADVKLIASEIDLIELSDYPSEYFDTVYNYVVSECETYGYESCELFEVEDNSGEGYLFLNFNFDGKQYEGVSLDVDTLKLLKVYDTKLTDILTQNWEFN